MLGYVLVAVAAFVSTNLDDLVLLIGFVADPAKRMWQVWVGQYLGFIVIVAISLLCSILALELPHSYLRLFGLAPLSIGIWKLIHPAESDTREPGLAAAGVAEIAVLTLSSGADNVTVYVPLFASSTRRELATALSIFAVLVGVWCAIAYLLVNHERLGSRIKYLSRASFPWILLVIGSIILLQPKWLP